jgi:hypothetical protein
MCCTISFELHDAPKRHGRKVPDFDLGEPGRRAGTLPERNKSERARFLRHLATGRAAINSVTTRATIASQNDKFSPAALVNDVSRTPGPGSMKQIASHPLVSEELSPLAPLFTIQTLFEQLTSNGLQLVPSGYAVYRSALKAECFHRDPHDFFFTMQNLQNPRVTASLSHS